MSLKKWIESFQLFLNLTFPILLSCIFLLLLITLNNFVYGFKHPLQDAITPILHIDSKSFPTFDSNIVGNGFSRVGDR